MVGKVKSVDGEINLNKQRNNLGLITTFITCEFRQLNKDLLSELLGGPLDNVHKIIKLRLKWFQNSLIIINFTQKTSS